MKSNLSVFANIPIAAPILKSAYPQLSEPNHKLSSLEREGKVIRLKRGLYVVSPEESNRPLSRELIANHIYAPSYVSMLSALRYYGLIPETVNVVQSMTVKATRSFNTPLGRFDYTHISRDTFSIGVRIENKTDYAFTIATPEKALCDLVAYTPGVNLRYMTDVKTYLEEDIRFDMDALQSFNPDILYAYAECGKKSDSIKTIIKFLQR